MTGALARLSGIDRRFGSVVALDGAELELLAGEVHGVLGANGAGKTTLLNVLGGMLRPDAGTIEVQDVAVVLDSPRDAWHHGIALVHQHFTLVPALSVLENLALGVRRGAATGERRDRWVGVGRGLKLPLAAVRAEAERLMERVGLRVPLGVRVEDLGVGDRQRTEILKALLKRPRVLVLDEPTAVLTPDETEGLFSLLRDLAADGRAVALVAHKLDEVLGVADRVTVLRAGRTVLSTLPGNHDISEFVRAMVGGDVPDPIAIGVEAEGVRATREPGGAVARLEGVSARRAGAEPTLRDVSLEVRGGEIVGVAGVEGNGQHELALLLAGRLSPDEGAVGLPLGIGFIPQDRTTAGVIADFDLTENVALALHRDPSCRDGVWLRWDRMERHAEEIRERHGVTAPSVETVAGALSGGNQQRLVVGRELGMASEMLVAENPTRGLDVAASAFVHDELRRMADEGVAVVLVSTDLDEVLALSDRLFAMARGRLTAVPDARRTREGVGALMLGGGGEVA